MAELENEQIPQLSIATTVEPDGQAVVALSGELDASNAPSLESAVSSIAGKQPERLIFDMSDLRFMDSAGIAVLIGAAAQVGDVRLRNPSRIVRRVVEVTGLTTVLPFEG